MFGTSALLWFCFVASGCALSTHITSAPIYRSRLIHREAVRLEFPPPKDMRQLLHEVQ